MKTDFKERGYEALDWIHVTEDTDQVAALVNTIMNILVPLFTRSFWKS
jgi:hypothetical protein